MFQELRQAWNASTSLPSRGGNVLRRASMAANAVTNPVKTLEKVNITKLDA